MIRFSVILLALLMPVGTDAAASDFTDSRPDDVLTIFDCDFGKGWDNNYNRWPDNWIRVAGVKFPQFIKAEIAKTSDQGGLHQRGLDQGSSSEEELSSLTVNLNGGAFAAYSEPVEASNHYGYKLEVDVLVSGVTNDHARISLQFLDEKQQLVREVRSNLIGDTDGRWLRVEIGTDQAELAENRLGSCKFGNLAWPASRPLR